MVHCSRRQEVTVGCVRSASNEPEHRVDSHIPERSRRHHQKPVVYEVHEHVPHIARLREDHHLSPLTSEPSVVCVLGGSALYVAVRVDPAVLHAGTLLALAFADRHSQLPQIPHDAGNEPPHNKRIDQRSNAGKRGCHLIGEGHVPSRIDQGLYRAPGDHIRGDVGLEEVQDPFPFERAFFY